MREPDAEWERWSLVMERFAFPQKRVLYRANLKKTEPEEFGDCRDRFDDLRFAAEALAGHLESEPPLVLGPT